MPPPHLLSTRDVSVHEIVGGYHESPRSTVTRDYLDFTLAELKSLRVKQRYKFRDQQYNGKFSIITFEEFIAIALDADGVVGIYPEIKNPVLINQHGLRCLKVANFSTSYSITGMFLSGPKMDALAYAEWVKYDQRFSDILVQTSPALNGHAFPRLKLRYKPSLVKNTLAI